MPSPIYPEPHSCSRCFSPTLLFSFHGSGVGRTVADTEVYMFDLLYDEAVTLGKDSSPDKNDGCAFMNWLVANLPPVPNAPGWGQLQALVGEHSLVKTHLYLHWVDGQYTPWLRSFRSIDGLYRPSPAGRTGKEKLAGQKRDAGNVRLKSSGMIGAYPIRIENELEVMGVLEKDWQEESAEEKGHYLLADEPVDDSDDELQDDMGESSDFMADATDSVKMMLCASEHDPSAREVSTRPPNMNPSSASSLEMIRRWFNECPRNPTSNRFGQHSSSLQSYPKRLLHITGDGSIPSLRLVDFSADIPSATRTMVPPYVALSYCWGHNQTNVLRNENLFEWLTDVSHTQLPQTIKDAVQITQVLGFRHIWVDAFCIIQNGIHDKHEEIQKMGHIYENAEVTISASRASTCHEGFLQSRQTPGEGSFRIPFRCRDGQTGTALLWYNRSEEWDEPIDRRGWTLQESLISSRMLEFGTHQTRWHCSCARYGVPHNSTNNGHLVDGWTRDKIERSPVNIDWAPVVVGIEEVDRFRNRVPTQTQRRLEKHVVQTWKRLVRNYTRRAVSDPMDRLPALSAIAQRLEGLSTYRYAGGLWFGDDIALQLLFWYPAEIGIMVRRSPERAAPSWSWASVIGAVDFMEIARMDITFLKSTHDAVVIWGMLSRATVCRTGSDPVGFFYTGTSDYEERHPFEGIAMMEVPSIVPRQGQPSESMYLLELDYDDGTGLVLRKVTEGVYCRAGRYEAVRKKGVAYQALTATSWSTTWAPRRYFTRARITLI